MMMMMNSEMNLRIWIFLCIDDINKNFGSVLKDISMPGVRDAFFFIVAIYQIIPAHAYAGMGLMTLFSTQIAVLL